MVRLLDHIFAEVEQFQADKTQIHAYLDYLNEIIAQGTLRAKESKYLDLKARLEQRLRELDRQQSSR
jgi:hypothetical protein